MKKNQRKRETRIKSGKRIIVLRVSGYDPRKQYVSGSKEGES